MGFSLPSFSDEPVVYSTAAGALIDVAIGLGVPIDPALKTAIMVAIPAVLAIFVRQHVTPVR